MSSTRLPGKVLAEIAPGVTVLDLLLRRVARARELDQIIVATSTQSGDDPVRRAAENAGADVVRGPLADVLERFRMAAAASRADAVVRITADCPLIDPALVDELVRVWRNGDAGYVSNTFEPRSFPDGLDAEVISREALEAAAADATDDRDREHVTPFLRRSPGRFVHSGLRLDPPYGDIRITLDHPEDLARLRELVGTIGMEGGLHDVLSALDLPEARIVPDGG
jgi:spore coat polysaccharide biosynthesis protein SpsF (cytidylyltransferase family)